MMVLLLLLTLTTRLLFISFVTINRKMDCLASICVGRNSLMSYGRTSLICGISWKEILVIQKVIIALQLGAARVEQ